MRHWRISTHFGELRLVPWFEMEWGKRSTSQRLRAQFHELDRFTLIDICEELGLVHGDAGLTPTHLLKEAVDRAITDGWLFALDVPRRVPPQPPQGGGLPGGVPPPEPPPAPPGPVVPPPQAQPPAQKYVLTDVKWLTTEAFCGDEASLQAVVQGNPPGGKARIEIISVAAGGARTTAEVIQADLVGGRVDAKWIAKAQSADWRKDHVTFKIDVVGLSGESANEFKFKQRPIAGWQKIDVNHPCTGNFAPVVELHDACLEANQVHYNLKIKLTGVGLSEARRANAKRLAEAPWNDQFSHRRFHREKCKRGAACNCQFDCCKVGFHLDVNFVESGEHVSVEVKVSADPRHPGISAMGRTGGRFYEPPLDEISMYPHEVGHLLGQYDEYAGGGTDPSGVQPAPSPVPNMMSAGLNLTLLNRHYRWVLAFLNGKTGGDTYAIIPP